MHLTYIGFIGCARLFIWRRQIPSGSNSGPYILSTVRHSPCWTFWYCASENHGLVQFCETNSRLEKGCSSVKGLNAYLIWCKSASTKLICLLWKAQVMLTSFPVSFKNVERLSFGQRCWNFGHSIFKPTSCRNFCALSLRTRLEGNSPTRYTS